MDLVRLCQRPDAATQGSKPKFVRFVSFHCASCIERSPRSHAFFPPKNQSGGEHTWVQSRQIPSSASSPAARRVRRVEELFRERSGEPVTLREAAAAAGCSVRSLQLAFQQHYGMTPMAVLRRIRLEAAWEALTRGDPPASIREIAAQYGFSNPGRFAKLCQDTFGQSPTQMLRQTKYQ